MYQYAVLMKYHRFIPAQSCVNSKSPPCARGNTGLKVSRDSAWHHTGDVTCMVTGGLSKFVAQCTVLNGYDSLKFTELCISITEYRSSCNFVSSYGAKGDSGRCISRFFAHKSYWIQWLEFI
jgi:hypothetical protein